MQGDGSAGGNGAGGAEAAAAGPAEPRVPDEPDTQGCETDEFSEEEEEESEEEDPDATASEEEDDDDDDDDDDDIDSDIDSEGEEYGGDFEAYADRDMPVLEVQPRTTAATPATTTVGHGRWPAAEHVAARLARLAQYEREAPVTTRSGTTRRAMDYPLLHHPDPPDAYINQEGVG